MNANPTEPVSGHSTSPATPSTSNDGQHVLNLPPQRLRASLFWGIRQYFPKRLSVLLSCGSVGLLLSLWAIASYCGWVDSLFLPSPTKVLKAGTSLFLEKDLLLDVLASARRVLLGFLAAAVLGIPIGVAMGTFTSMNSIFGPVVSLVRYMPIVAFVPLIIFWAGIGEISKILVVFMALVLYNALMVADAIKFIPSDMINVAYTLGGRRRDVLWKVIVPAALPSILDTLRVNVANAWNFLVVAEFIAAQQGIGFRILISQRSFQTDKVIFCVVLIGLIGWLLDFALQRLSLAIAPWADQTRLT